MSRQDDACSLPGCELKQHAKGFCHLHYRQNLRATAPKNACGCGCGGLTLYRFVHGHHTRLFSNEEQARRGRQNDGSTQRDTGEGKTYRKLRQRHEHRVVAERMLGRALLPGEIVHHKDGDKRNNAPGNLEVMTQAEHARRHAQERRRAA